MFGFKFTSAIFLTLLTSYSVAHPVEPVADLEARATCVYHCGSVCYWQSDIDEALAQGYSLYKSGSTVGSNDYPHTYNDYEGFTFPSSGPYEEFPILSSYTVYTGGSPGADRVIFNTKGSFEALLTHTGASGNNFVQCTKG